MFFLISKSHMIYMRQGFKTALDPKDVSSLSVFASTGDSLNQTSSNSKPNLSRLMLLCGSVSYMSSQKRTKRSSMSV